MRESLSIDRRQLGPYTVVNSLASDVSKLREFVHGQGWKLKVVRTLLYQFTRPKLTAQSLPHKRRNCQWADADPARGHWIGYVMIMDGRCRSPEPNTFSANGYSTLDAKEAAVAEALKQLGIIW